MPTQREMEEDAKLLISAIINDKAFAFHTADGEYYMISKSDLEQARKLLKEVLNG